MGPSSLSRARAAATEGPRLLVVVPRLPAGAEDRSLRRFVAELAAVRPLDLLPAGPSRAEETYLRALTPRAALP
ncbi:MAG: hypothetical protein KGM24_03760, partial [Elusimicrobia bacterium]|nr:hypothetical protein [Elusimicrobiota bacterium]